MRPYRWALMQYNWSPYNRRLRHRHTEGRPLQTVGEDSHLQAEETGFWKKQFCRDFTPRLLASRTMRKQFSVV